MEYVKFGNTGMDVSQICLGTMSFGADVDWVHKSWALNEEDSHTIIKRALDLGGNFFDTANGYAKGQSEKILGKAIKDFANRDEVVIATKFGIKRVDGKQVLDSKPEVIRSSIEGSLKRLQIETIDLYYQHRGDPNTPIEEVAGVIQDLMKDGKIKHWGLSEAGAETIHRAPTIEPLTAVESEYSMMWRNPEEVLLPTLEELGIGFVPFAPLGKGFLTATIDKNTIFGNDDFRSQQPRFQSENMEANMVLVGLIKEIAAEKNVTPGQIALAWLLAQKTWIVPIPGTRKLNRLEENLGAVNVELTPEELSNLNNALSKIELVGGCYPVGSDYEKRTGK